MASEETALLLDPENEDEVWIRNKILHHMTRYRNNDHLWITNKEHLLTSKLIINTSHSIEKWSSSPLRARILVELRLLWRRSRFQRSLSSQYSRPFLGLVSDHFYLQAYIPICIIVHICICNLNYTWRLTIIPDFIRQTVRSFYL